MTSENFILFLLTLTIFYHFLCCMQILDISTFQQILKSLKISGAEKRLISDAKEKHPF